MVLSVQTKLLRSIDEHLASYVELWNHISSQLNSGGSPDSQQFLTSLVPILQQKGLQSSFLNKQLLHAELRAEVPRTLLFYDNQWLDGPHELMHSAALLAALDVCKNVLGFVPVNIQWVLDGSETEMNLEALETLQADACICYHAAEAGLGNNEMPVLTSATKGRLRVELEVQTGGGAIDSMHGGIAPDALWRLLWALGTLKDAHEDILIEGFYDTLASVPDDVMTQLRTLPDNADELAHRWGIQQPLMGLHGFQLHYAHLLLPTCTVHSIISNPLPISTENELAGTLLPTQAKAQLDFYLVPDQDPQDIFNKLQHHLQRQDFSDVQARILSVASPLSTPVSNSFIQLAISATEKAYEQTPYVLPTTVGSYTAPASWMKEVMPIVFMARNGRNRETDFARIIKQIALLIEGMGHGTGTTE